jgi:ZIP family zinc transporter
MVALDALILVFVAGLITDLATGLGAVPFFFKDDFSDFWLVGLWGIASGIMAAASIFGLIPQGLAEGQVLEVIFGLGIGVALVVVASRLIDDHELEPGRFEEADLKRLLLILGVLTVHSFPEGVAIGVSFAELGLQGGIQILGFAVPILAISMTIAISIHNIPEGVAISIPFKSMGMSNWRMLGATIFSSLPQPIGAVIAFYFVRQAQIFLPIGFGFAAGAMLYLVGTEFVEEAREQGEGLSDWRRPFMVGAVAGFIIMLPLLLIGDTSLAAMIQGTIS